MPLSKWETSVSRRCCEWRSDGFARFLCVCGGGDGGGICIVSANAIETRHSMIFIWSEWEMIYVYWWCVCVCGVCCCWRRFCCRWVSTALNRFAEYVLNIFFVCAVAQLINADGTSAYFSFHSFIYSFVCARTHFSPSPSPLSCHSMTTEILI